MKKFDLMLCLACFSAIASGCTLERACNDQDLRCNTDSETQKGIRYTCIDGAWLNAEEGNSCKDDKTWGVCINGAKKCEDGGMKTCVNGMWSEPDNSCGNRGCMNESKCAVCGADDTVCDKETNRYRVCMNGVWSSMDVQCSSGMCNEEGTACAEMIECIDANVECYEGTLKTCKNGKWLDEKCPNDAACKLENNGCSECKTGETSCSDGVYRVCINESWSKETKSCTCKNDRECTECTAGQKECDSPNSIRTCTNDNVWGESKTCNGSCSLEKVECVEEASSCKDDQKMCFGSLSYICHDNKWTESESCQFGCNPETNECYTCIDGETSCIDGKIQTCVHNSWSEVRDCKGGTCIDEKTCANCVLGINCTNSNTSVGTVTKCEDGITQTQQKCAPYSCTEKNECGECTNGNQKCEVGKDGVVGIPMICVNGVWTYGNSCPGDTSCSSEVACGDCRNDSTKCEDGKQFHCIGGKWAEPTDCVNGCNASLTACVPSDVCINGSEKCDNKVKYTCVGNAWGNENACAGGASCKNSEACGECENNATQCSDKKVKTCTNGVWGEPSSCSDGADCQSNAKCGECINGKSKCSEGRMYQCEGGLWKPGALCDGSASCKNPEECGDCSNGTEKCEMNTSDIGIRSSCVNGQWLEGVQCTGSASCKDGKNCGECKNGSTTCENGIQKTCVNGKWGQSTSCANGCSSSGLVCAPSDVCVNNKIMCDSGVSYKCESNAWVSQGQCTNGASCMNGTTCGVCSNGDKKCDANKAYVCSAGSWGTGTSCAHGCSGKVCAECTAGDKKCENNVAKECLITKKWSSGLMCQNGCDGNVCFTSECSTNEKKCTNRNDGVGQYLSCSNGKWSTTTTTCSSNNSCNNDGTGCGVCKNGAKTCSGNNLMTCRNGEWDDKYACNVACNTATNSCIECADTISVTSGINKDVYCVTGDVIFEEGCTDFNYPNLKTVGGSFKANPNYVANLSKIYLNALESVKGDIDLPAKYLKILEMDNLNEMGSFTLQYSQVEQLKLDKLTKVKTMISVLNNPQLESINLSLNEFTNGDGIIEIRENEILDEIYLNNLNGGVSSITISKNDELTTIELPALTSLKRLEIDNNGISVFKALNLKEIDELVITNNEWILYFEFASEVQINSLLITGNNNALCGNAVCKLIKALKNPEQRDITIDCKCE